MPDYFGIFETDAKKVVLYHDNKTKFDRLLDKALETYARKRQIDKARSAARREFKQYDWEVPEERVYDSEKKGYMTAKRTISKKHGTMHYRHLSSSTLHPIRKRSL